MLRMAGQDYLMVEFIIQIQDRFLEHQKLMVIDMKILRMLNI